MPATLTTPNGTTPHSDAATVAFDAALLEAASKAKAAYPDERLRIERGLAICLADGVTLLADGTAQVASQSHPGECYRVNGHCTCLDVAEAPDGRCKHKWGRSLSRWARAACAGAPEASPGPVETPASLDAPTVPEVLTPFLTHLHGKAFVRYAGLLALAHERGLVRLDARIEFHSETLVLASATATFADGRTFTEWADATPANVTAQVRPHWIRMALTRAKARALRDALNIAVVALEELGEVEHGA